MHKSTHTHEFKAPINRIKGLVQILCTDPSLTPHDRTSIKGLIDTNTHRLQRSAESLLLYFTWDPQTIQRETLDTEEIKETLVDLIASAKFNHKASVDTVINGSAQSQTIDKEWWWLAADHLLSNAFKFSADQHIQITLVSATEGLTLIVEDKGKGMMQLEKATTAFWQESEGLNRTKSGLGLGLTITDSIAKAHGGTLVLKSQPGAGMKAELFLPSA